MTLHCNACGTPIPEQLLTRPPRFTCTEACTDALHAFLRQQHKDFESLPALVENAADRKALADFKRFGEGNQ